MSRVTVQRLERFECRMTPNTKKRLRLYALDNGISMSEAVDRLIWNAHVSQHMRKDMSIQEAQKYYHNKLIRNA